MSIRENFNESQSLNVFLWISFTVKIFLLFSKQCNEAVYQNNNSNYNNAIYIYIHILLFKKNIMGVIVTRKVI